MTSYKGADSKKIEARRKYGREYGEKWRARHAKKLLAKKRVWNASNPDKVKKNRQMTRYGKAPPAPAHCEACGVPATSLPKGLFVDHDHNTGLVRGWLCHHCNCALGFAKDSRDRLQLLINYLDRHELLR